MSSVFDILRKKQPETPRLMSFGDVERRIAEAERRIEQQKNLVESMAVARQDTREGSFDLSRMYLLLALLHELSNDSRHPSSPPRHQTASM